MGKKTNSDVAALKRAVKAIMASSSHRAAKAAVNYMYDAFVVHPAKETILYFANREAAQQSVHPTDGGHSQADEDSNPATISG